MLVPEGLPRILPNQSMYAKNMINWKTTIQIIFFYLYCAFQGCQILYKNLNYLNYQHNLTTKRNRTFVQLINPRQSQRRCYALIHFSRNLITQWVRETKKLWILIIIVIRISYTRTNIWDYFSAHDLYFLNRINSKHDQQLNNMSSTNVQATTLTFHF